MSWNVAGTLHTCIVHEFVSLHGIRRRVMYLRACLQHRLEEHLSVHVDVVSASKVLEITPRNLFTLMGAFVLDDNSVSDLTSQITQLESPVAYGSFDDVYRCTISAGEGTIEVAVKVFKNNAKRTEKGLRRELKVWLKLRHSTIVPLLGIAFLDHPFPALVSQWMPSGTLQTYLENQATTLPTPAKVGLAKGVADGLNYLHSENVVHGNLHPGNVLIDGSGNPCLTDFGLATVVGDVESQWTTTTASYNFDPRWRAPEVIGIDRDPGRPTFKSDIYSFGSVLFFIASGDTPWQEKRHSYQIIIELSRRVRPVRPGNILDNHWNLIQKCWSWDPEDRPRCAEIPTCMSQFRIDDPQARHSLQLPSDLTGQIYGTTNDYVVGGSFGNVYRCEWRRPTGPVEVAVKVIRFHTSKEDSRRFRREAAIWARLVHENIVSLFGTTEGFGPSIALVSPWFPHGTLFRLIAQQGIKLSIWSRLNLLHDVASGLHYLHSFPIVHGDISSSNVMVDVREGRYKACLTDFGLATVFGGLLDGLTLEKSTVQHGAVRWTAPELLIAYDHPDDVKPTTQNDMYSFGRVMFHVLTLVSPWSDIDDYGVFRRILSGEEISRPEKSDATHDITDARWYKIQQCWSIDPSTRPSASMAMDFLESQLQAVTDNDVPISEVTERRQGTSLVDAEHITASNLKYPNRTKNEETGSPYERRPRLVMPSNLVDCGVQSQVNTPAHGLGGITRLPEPLDLTGQIFGTINDHIATGAYGNVYRCEWRQPMGPVKVAVKVFKSHITEADLRRLRREVGIWSRLVHENIAPLVGTTEKFGPLPALVSMWFPHGTLLRLITEQGARLNIRTKLNLLHDIASGLNYLHDFPIVHGDITSGNVLVDIKEGEYKACLTDFGLSTVLGGPLNDRTVEGSAVRNGAIRWTAPELLRLHDRPTDVKPTKQSDMYSFGRVMFHVFTLRVPWNDIDFFQVFHKILAGEEITRPEIPHMTPDITSARWNVIELCWSVDPSARPSALMAMDSLRSELEALADDRVSFGRARESYQRPSLDMAHTEQIIVSRPICLSPTEVGYTGSPYEHPPWPTLPSDPIACGVKPQAGTISTRLPQSSSRTTLVQPLSPSGNFTTNSDAFTMHMAATASSLSISRPLNVLIFGETGVGKSSVINLIMGRDVARTSPDAAACTLEHTPYEITLENQRFKLWEVSSIAPMNFFRRFFAKWRMKKTYKKLYSDEGVFLLLYCMRNSRAQGTMVSHYKFFTSIVGSTTGRVPVAAVVTCLEDYPMDMDDWWKREARNLESQGMRFSKHACITSLPEDPDASPSLRVLRERSVKIIRSLICESYQVGRAPIISGSAPIS